MTLIKILFVTLVLAVAITYFSLHKNKANLFEAPGVVERLQIFLKTNSAKTSANHQFKELRTPQFEMNSERLYKSVLSAATNLGWEVLTFDRENQNANFVVYSDVFLFEDDIYVQVQYIDQNLSSLHIESHSRTGRADFAANSGHIQALINELK
ncbi:hypothetical protein MNBD_GAMMA05-2605 [hydrothermal vent metagenome]|uniref:DUF1499 domain-containing protein n=1 Tax=hydrothermal vent metagenome TaxID=652676 RepID=A0A3B0WJ80_9ZZZZ